MRRQWIVWWIVASCALAACSRQESGWREAASADSVPAYEQYLQSYPAGAHAREARERILALRDEEAWARAGRLRTPEGWQRYLGDWPEGRHAAAARRQLHAYLQSEPPAGSGPFSIQLGAFSTRAAADAGLQRLAQERAPELEGLTLRLLARPEHAPELWRLRAGPFAEPAARELCARLLARGVDCVPVVE